MTPTHPIRLSRRQDQILGYIKTSIVERGFPPSIREIGLQVDLSSSSTVHSHLKSIENKGYIKRDPSKPRSIQVLDMPTRQSPLVVHHNLIAKHVAGLQADLQPALAPTSEGEALLVASLAQERYNALQLVADYLKLIDPAGGLQ